jgi:hypothetical protein
LALGKVLWEYGISAYSPTIDADRHAIQPELERWRAMEIEDELIRQAERLEAKGEKIPLDPRHQSAWFSLDPQSGMRKRLEKGRVCPAGHWLSPGAALRPLMQSLLLPVEAVILGPGERAYWRLIETLWDSIGLKAPEILPRPSVFVLDGDCNISVDELESLRLGYWEAFGSADSVLPSALPFPKPDMSWSDAVSGRYSAEIIHLQKRLKRLDSRLTKERAEKRVGKNIERLRQTLFPFGKAQERLMPGWYWLKNKILLEAMLRAMESGEQTYIIRPEFQN